MKPIPRNIIIVAVGVAVIAGFFVHPAEQVMPFGFIQGDIWLDEFYVKLGDHLYKQHLTVLPYRWVLSLAVVAIVGALVFGHRKSN
jgi:hypothetical protein